MKECPKNESFADGNVGAGVRLMVRGGCLPLRGSERMTWKYEDDMCRCGLVETETHIQHTHSQHLSTSKRALQMIKVLTATGWGKQKETLMATYKAVMRPAREYDNNIQYLYSSL